jgi:hypothetical protein
VCDELAFWRSDDSANPDTEILQAVRPGLATTSGPLICSSSPYGRSGELWKAYKAHHGVDGDPVLTWQAPSLVMNPSIPAHVVEQAFADDPVAASAEYGAQFRSDVAAFITQDVVQSCTIPGRTELPPEPGVRYSAFVDPSGGSQDSFTACIAHMVGDVSVIDAIKEFRPPFNPEHVTAELAAFCRSYGVSRVVGDRYGGVWVSSAFRSHGIAYGPAKAPKSELYAELLPKLNAGRVELLDIHRLFVQLATLERHTARSGRESIDHAPGAHDDLANVVAGVVSLLVTPRISVGLISLDRQKQAREWLIEEIRQRTGGRPL